MLESLHQEFRHSAHPVEATFRWLDQIDLFTWKRPMRVLLLILVLRSCDALIKLRM
jgi:hypothetical protein